MLEGRSGLLKLLKKVAILFIPAYVIAALVIFIDPYFHYHKPLSFINYVIDDERYQNDGILRNFEYDSILTGTSLMENIKVTDVDKLFGIRAIKVPFSGGYYSEISQALNQALNKRRVKKVIMPLTYTKFINTKYDYWGNEQFVYPKYLYDDSIFNDLEYLFSLKTLKYCFLDIKNTIKRIPMTNFDDYANWMHTANFGKETVLKEYKREKKNDTTRAGLTEKEKNIIKENIKINLIELIAKYPETEFILYFPPMSIVYWDSLSQAGEVDVKLEEIKMTIEGLLQLNNVKMYYFVNDEKIITNLDNYKDSIHYNQDVDKYILYSIRNNMNKLSKKNYQEYIEKSKQFFDNYHYDSIFD